MRKSKGNQSQRRWVVSATVWSFVLAVVISIITRLLLEAIYSLVVSFFILVAVIAFGIVFDLVGTAAAAAEQAPLNAKAARKKYGARRAVDLVQQADRVASICNDIVGDISGIVSGTLAAVIILRLAEAKPLLSVELYGGVLLTALVAALTVGGKAWGKNIAINRSTEIILFTGRILTRFDDLKNWAFRKRKKG